MLYVLYVVCTLCCMYFMLYVLYVAFFDYTLARTWQVSLHETITFQDLTILPSNEPQMAADKEAISLSKVYSYYSTCITQDRLHVV